MRPSDKRQLRGTRVRPPLDVHGVVLEPGDCVRHACQSVTLRGKVEAIEPGGDITVVFDDGRRMYTYACVWERSLL